ncbi:MAG: VTT domain-containing protein, partial [Burkholderiaceae bacterium]|nr:VTT domain-containing protein [Burkholderiaceae bacterium]
MSASPSSGLSSVRKKVIVVALLAAAVGVFILSDLDRLLSLEALKSSVDHFRQWQAHEPLLVGVGFFLAYVLVVALSVPGAVVMTLGAGAVFGLGWGIVIVSFASSLGALLAFLVARHLLRDWVQERFANRLQAINAGVAREGAFYLFTLRLVPIFPFFLINLVMGLTPLRARTFYWVSQLGMLAGTVVYVNAGVQLAGIDSLSGIISPPVMLSFILLGCFPLLAKAVPDVLRRRRVFARWRRPASFDRNLIVIGGGAAGLVTAYIAAAVKARVTLVEAHKMGGDCLNYGCVPSKALIKTARLAEQIRHGAQYGLKSTPPQFNFRDVMARVQRVISEIAPHDSIERYTTLGVDVVSGRARLVDPWTVEIARNDGTTQCLTARSIV